MLNRMYGEGVTGEPANPGLLGRMAIKPACVCVCVCVKLVIK